MKAVKAFDGLKPKERGGPAAGKPPPRQSAHRYYSLEDVKAGRVPKPTAEEIAQRQEAIRMAHEIRARTNIFPLTTSEIIRELRNRTELDQ